MHPETPSSIEICANCGSDFTHLASVHTVSTGKDRRLGCELVFGCEHCKGSFTLRYENVKGHTVVSVLA